MDLDLHIRQSSVHCGRADLDSDNRVECCYCLLKRLKLDELVWENTEFAWKWESVHQSQREEDLRAMDSSTGLYFSSSEVFFPRP